MCVLSVEGMEDIRHKKSPAADEPLFSDISVTSRPSSARKRTHPSSANTIISSAEVAEVTSEPEPEGTRSAKRQRPATQRAGSLILDPVSTPRSTPLRTPSGPVSRSRASNEPSPGSLGSNGKGDVAGTPDQLPNNLEENSDDSAYVRGTVEELLQSPRRSTSPFKGIEDEQDIDRNSDRREKKRKGSGNKVGGNLHESNQVDKVSCRLSAKTSQRRKRSDHPVQEKGHGPSRTALRPRGSGTMPTRVPRQVASSQPRQPHRLSTGSVTRSRSPRTSASGTKAGDGTNIHSRPSLDMSYQITDLTLCPVPKGSSIVTATVRYRDSKLSLDPVAPNHKLLGREGKVICMTQLSTDSWMLVGYRYDDVVPSACSRGSPTLLNIGRASMSLGDSASDDNDGSSDEDEDEACEEDHVTRTRALWLESDEQRLLSLKDRQCMEWEEVFKRFPNRTPGAVKLRYYALRKKDS
ncbi:hypothetical protein BU23DRAFT_131519 [Bimuria novae-zelandiae CBS 107.79]|uniref:Myb-like domain-containing protein n=1 Tax=Bimuria novae-zelandiae CBS 107.79 TaxID=1447943 RepID=A0A6A5VJC2_9PLEO|nr:hypothetical protein BU23DRAFT_131519 [Bimuria novae-zelandiae CBS 107.79]